MRRPMNLRVVAIVTATITACAEVLLAMWVIYFSWSESVQFDPHEAPTMLERLIATGIVTAGVMVAGLFCIVPVALFVGLFVGAARREWIDEQSHRRGVAG